MDSQSGFSFNELITTNNCRNIPYAAWKLSLSQQDDKNNVIQLMNVMKTGVCGAALSGKVAGPSLTCFITHPGAPGTVFAFGFAPKDTEWSTGRWTATMLSYDFQDKSPGSARLLKASICRSRDLPFQGAEGIHKHLRQSLQLFDRVPVEGIKDGREVYCFPDLGEGPTSKEACVADELLSQKLCTLLLENWAATVVKVKASLERNEKSNRIGDESRMGLGTLTISSKAFKGQAYWGLRMAEWLPDTEDSKQMESQISLRPYKSLKYSLFSRFY